MSWLFQTAVSAMITSICCIALTFMAVNTYVDLILDQLHIERPATAKIDWKPFVNRLSSNLGFGGGLGEANGPKNAEASVNASGTNLTETGSKDSKESSSSAGKSGERDPYRVPEDAVAVWGQTSTKELEGGSPLSREDQKVVVSSEELTKKKDQMSKSDKAKVFTLLASRLPAEDIQKISLLMEDGLNTAEVKELQTILQKHLKPEEYKEILDFIKTP